MSRSSAFEAWVEEARAVSVEQALAGRGATLKASGSERIGPCPLCKGHDGFSIHPVKRVFNCRRAGVGGDAIALVQHLDGCDFRVACEILTGRPPPGREAGETEAARAERQAAQAERAAQADRDAERADAESNRFREQERARCAELWQSGVPLAGTAAEAYLTLRGLVAPEGVRLRCAVDHFYWERVKNRQSKVVWTILHRGPALLAPIHGPDRTFSGLHATWIDLAQPKGKLELFHPDTGEQLPAKKVRGSAKGGFIPLLHRPGATELLLGEGNETVLSVWRALAAAGDARADTASFWCGYSLGNIGGKALGTVAHPTEATVDRLGRRRARRVPGPVPDFAYPSIPIPPTVRKATLLGDGDSDPTLTGHAMTRAGRRIHAQRPDCAVGVAWAPTGEDFNDVLRRAAA